MHELLIYWGNQARKDDIGKTRGKKKKKKFPQLKSLKLNLINSLLNYFYLNKGVHGFIYIGLLIEANAA